MFPRGPESSFKEKISPLLVYFFSFSQKFQWDQTRLGGAPPFLLPCFYFPPRPRFASLQHPQPEAAADCLAPLPRRAFFLGVCWSCFPMEILRRGRLFCCREELFLCPSSWHQKSRVYLLIYTQKRVPPWWSCCCWLVGLRCYLGTRASVFQWICWMAGERAFFRGWWKMRYIFWWAWRDCEQGVERLKMILILIESFWFFIEMPHCSSRIV